MSSFVTRTGCELHMHLAGLLGFLLLVVCQVANNVLLMLQNH